MSNDAGHSNKSLQILSSQGDEKAFRALFDRYRDKLHRYLLNIVKSNEVAEELVMDVFLKLWLARDMITEIENLDGFLFRVAYNKSIDFFRAAARDKKLTDVLWEQIQIPSQSLADDPILTQEFESRLREAIDLLPPQRKKIFNLYRTEGLSHTQIAQELGISKYTVANTIVEARQFIKSYLAKNLDFVVLMTILSSAIKNK